jgi:hypothetical protein
MRKIVQPAFICGLILTCALSKADDLLSVDETVALAQQGYIDQVGDDVRAQLRRANPKARPLLYAILDDPSKEDRWGTVAGFFFYVGTDVDDVRRLALFIQRQRGLLRPLTRNAVYKVFDALGGMAARGVEGAKRELAAMASPKYWKGKTFQLWVEPIPNYPSEEQMLAARALLGYGYSREGDLPNLAQALLAEVKGPAQREVLQVQVDNALSLAKYYLEKDLQANKSPPPVDAKKRPQDPVIREWQPRPPADLIMEAVKEYEVISKMLVDQDLDAFIVRAAGNGVPIFDENSAAEEIRAFLEIMKSRANELKVVVDTTNAVKHLPIMSPRSKVIVENETDAAGNIVGEQVVVKVPVSNTQSIGADLMRRGFRGQTIGRGGTLVVYMIRKNGTWYWNPFGW